MLDTCSLPLGAEVALADWFPSNLRGTFQSLFRLGSPSSATSVQIKNAASALEARNFDDSAYVITRGADAIGDNDYPTFRQIKDDVSTIRFTIGVAATTDSTTSIPANARVLEVRLAISTPYSPGATVSLGRAGSTSLIQAVTDNDPQSANTYTLPQDTDWGAAALPVRATVAGAPAAGAATILVSYSLPDA